MKAYILTLFFFGVSFFLHPAWSAFAAELPRGDFKTLTETLQGRVADVIDPLTLRLEDNTLLSLTGLDYPDLDYYAPGNFAVMTKRILGDFLKGEDIILYQTMNDGLGRTNRMGHRVGHIVRKKDDVWAQGLMLSLGLARVRTTKFNPEMASQLYAQEEAARLAKTGLWAVKGYQITDAANAKSAEGSFDVIEGEIQKAAMQKNRLFLNFGQDWRTDFTISISAANRRLFARDNLDPQSWGGKRIRVRGWVEDFNGPYIEVDHPQQIELLFERDTTVDPNLPPPDNTTEDEEESQPNPILEPPKRSIIRRTGALPE